MLIGTCRRLSICKRFKIQIGDIVLETVKSAKLLGIHIDNCLTWSTYSDILSSKISRKLGVLRSLRSFMSNDAHLKTYNCIVFLILTIVVQYRVKHRTARMLTDFLI